jgi:hypothetical protein
MQCGLRAGSAVAELETWHFIVFHAGTQYLKMGRPCGHYVFVRHFEKSDRKNLQFHQHEILPT